MTKLYRGILAAMLAAAIFGLGARAQAATQDRSPTNPSVYWRAFGPSDVNRVTFRHCGTMPEDALAAVEFVAKDGRRVTFRCGQH